ncbi:MAG: hypothetical protein V4473_01070 [Patescibacteria group bacterium]
MKTTACMIVMLALLLGAVMPLAAQEERNDPDVYVVMPGDSAWSISGDVFHNPLLWRQVVEKNPFLKAKGRITVNEKNGWTYVMLHPGEQLFGLAELGILPKQVPLSELGIKIPDPVVINQVSNWTWFILGLALLLLIAAYLIYRMLTRDPVNSRQAMMPGGVTDTTAPTVMQQVAARAAGYTRPVSTNSAIYQQFTIVRQTAGRIWGNMTVSYADGRSIPRRLSGERAYQAEVRFPDGHTETLYMLQGCGNDLRMGGISRYLPGPEFRFEADPAPVVPPATVPIAETPTSAPAEAPAPVVEPVATPQVTALAQPEINRSGEFIRSKDAPAVASGSGIVKLEIRRASFDNPAMLRMSGIDEKADTTCEVEEGMVTFRFTPKHHNSN